MKIELQENKHIGVMFSGGADSSILLYLLHKYNIEHNKNCRIVPYSVSRRTGTIIHTSNVLNYLKNYFKLELPDVIYVGDPDVHHSKFVWTGIKEVYRKYKADIIFTGTTKNPDIQLDTTFLYPAREDTVHFSMFCHPFFEIDKTSIISLYFENNIEEMLKLTHSCSIEVTGRCNKCFFCKEREWAFSKLGLTDPGTN
jgi:tRNA(Ile)-lysidine synthase TilS/MesJ